MWKVTHTQKNTFNNYTTEVSTIHISVNRVIIPEIKKEEQQETWELMEKGKQAMQRGIVEKRERDESGI